MKPLVEEAWTAPDTTEVIRLAREILRRLDIKESTRVQLQWMMVNAEDIPRERDEPALPFPAEAAEVSPGVESAVHVMSLSRMKVKIARCARFMVRLATMALAFEGLERIPLRVW